MNPPKAQKPIERPSYSLPQEAIERHREAEAERLEEEAMMLTSGTLMKHLTKRWKAKEVALQEFGRVASEVSKIEAETMNEGVLVTARWRHKYQEQSAGALFLTLFLGILGALLASSNSVKLEYTTHHRLPENIVRGFMLRRFFLSAGYVLGTAVAVIAGFVTLFSLMVFFDQYSSTDEKLFFILPLIVTVIAGVFAYKCKQWLVPPLLRIYGGGKFELIRIKRADFVR